MSWRTFPRGVGFYAVVTAVLVAEAFWVTTLGVELTDEAFVMRGLRKRVIPWRRIDEIRRGDGADDLRGVGAGYFSRLRAMTTRWIWLVPS